LHNKKKYSIIKWLTFTKIKIIKYMAKFNEGNLQATPQETGDIFKVEQTAPLSRQQEEDLAKFLEFVDGPSGELAEKQGTKNPELIELVSGSPDTPSGKLSNELTEVREMAAQSSKDSNEPLSSDEKFKADLADRVARIKAAKGALNRPPAPTQIVRPNTKKFSPYKTS
jgi:hypothetical protein